jgi:deoxyribodipyrimidine photo-lyase
MGVSLVWLKRDLRVRDHQPLFDASRRGPVVCLYVYEPELLGAEEFDPAHLVFINESLDELDRGLRARGGRITYRVGSMPGVLEELARELPIAEIRAHEETGRRAARLRDQRVRDWARERGIPFHELPQNGVVRGLRDRDGWSALWRERMSGEPLPAPPTVQAVPELDPGRSRTAADLGLPETQRPEVQRGGESPAEETLQSFLARRGVDYRQGMSSPVTAWESCSRISPYLAWGNLSMRQVHRATEQRRRELRALKRAGTEELDPRWPRSLSSFAGRLRWHCHFMQKLEDEPEIEFRNMARAYDGLREDEFDADRFEAWKQGRTGYPMVDACMRALHRSGWINFRMRAMLVSFASYHLWLDWRPTARYLARQFLDFEPGIHYPQFQMQSGTTGINTIRIYNPIKQARDHDPDGLFIRRYVPELAGVPLEHLHEPHRMSATEQRAAGCILGKQYPQPIVEHAAAYRKARERVAAVRRREGARAEAQRVYRKHGSRRRPSARRAKSSRG